MARLCQADAGLQSSSEAPLACPEMNGSKFRRVSAFLQRRPSSHSTFSPDGRWLAASGAKSFGVGDLAAVRQQLRELGMDWSEETAAHPR